MIEAEKQKAVDRAKVDEIADELIRKISARTSDESVHNGPGGTTAIPPYGLALEPMIGTGPDIPTSYANVLTAAEVARLREENQELRNRILQRGDYCSDCDVVYKFGKKEVRDPI